MLKVGLTGGLGAGKTTVSRAFAKLGAPIIDTDEISHALTAPNGVAIPAIREFFGQAVLNPDGGLDRAAMRARILRDAEAKRQLEAIMHPLIRREVERQLAETKASYVLVVIPLLVETGTYGDLLDRVLLVDCSEETQVQRALARGGWSEPEIRSMIARQAGRTERLSRADDVINTESKLAEVETMVLSLDQKYRLKAELAL